MEAWIASSRKGVCLRVRVAPRAPRNRIVELTDQYLKVALTAPPLEGRANRELVRFLSRAFCISEKQFCLRSGKGARLKTLEIQSDEPGLQERLTAVVRRDLSRELKKK